MVASQKQQFCTCGCGEKVNLGNRYIRGHNRRKQVNISSICRLYIQEEMSIDEVAEKIGYSHNLVKRCLHQHGFKTRSATTAAQLASRKGKGYMQTAEGRRRHGLVMKGHSFNRRLQYDRSFFKKPSRSMYYILGFIFADGCVSEDQRLMFSIKDEVLLEKIAQTIGKQTVRKLKSGYFSLTYCSKEMIRDLKRLGVTGRKTERLKPVYVPKQYLNHFIRGYFDGDGCISFNIALNKYVSCFSSSSPRFLEWIHKIIEIKSGCLRKYALNCFELRFGEPDTIRLGHFIYHNLNLNKDIYLERKWLRFQKLFNQINI